MNKEEKKSINKESENTKKQWETPQLIKEGTSITEGGAKLSLYEVPVLYHT